MILFLNFIPIEFMGGTEKWMNNTAKKINKYEKTQIISINPQIANLYGMLVAKRNYVRDIKIKIHNHISLDLQSFIPFTKKWKDTRVVFVNSRLIYTRYEVLEFLIVIYFSGISGLRKTIAGIHSPFIYNDPISFFDKLHNSLYGSWVYKFIFQHIKKVHVLNTKDERYFIDVLKLRNAVYVPNGADIPKIAHTKVMSNEQIPSHLVRNKNQLNVLFVGELSLRKGVDILIQLIEQSPKNYVFTIAGDGPMKQEVEELSENKKNCLYKGFISETAIEKLYQENDILILPSRAESMSLAILGALSYGLTIVDSKEVSLELDKDIEYSVENTYKGYFGVLEKLYVMKTQKKLDRKSIAFYFQKNFSSSAIYPQLFKKIFEI